MLIGLGSTLLIEHNQNNTNMNIGITFIGYECMDLMPQALQPWMDLRKNPSLVEGIDSVFISLSHGCFEETAQLGFPILSTDGSHAWMMKQK